MSCPDLDPAMAALASRTAAAFRAETSAPVTPETLTDEHLNRLRCGRDAFWIDQACRALGISDALPEAPARRGAFIADARRRCCDAINTRAQESK